MLEGEDLHEQIRHFVNDVISGYVDAETAEGFPTTGTSTVCGRP